MTYKGYTAHVEYDDDDRTLHGEVIDLKDVITFDGRSVTELRKAFRDSVDDYLEFCKERGEEPDRPFSGRLMVRLPPELHRAVYTRARQEGKSLNQYIADRLS